ncbi:MAG: hypothetical protein ACXW02_08295 [Halobacteriota archaeon]
MDIMGGEPLTVVLNGRISRRASLRAGCMINVCAAVASTAVVRMAADSKDSALPQQDAHHG